MGHYRQASGSCAVCEPVSIVVSALVIAAAVAVVASLFMCSRDADEMLDAATGSMIPTVSPQQLRKALSRRISHTSSASDLESKAKAGGASVSLCPL